MYKCALPPYGRAGFQLEWYAEDRMIVDKGGETVARRTLTERIAELDTKAQHLRAQKQALEAQAKQAARKQRTRTLIQVGGLMATLGVTTLEETQQLQAYIATHASWWAQWRSTT